ncbi:MAG: DNA-binding response regulator [Sideroxyarcus sp.]|nr:DNA-binding response regulator [Sideroxyarcus sp.]
MQTVTVAVAGIDRVRREGFERLLYGENGITVLSNAGPDDEGGNDHTFASRRFGQRAEVSSFENEVARIRRLRPAVTLVNLDMCADEDLALFLSLRSMCPASRIVLLADDAVNENKIIQALEIGAQGYLENDAVEDYLSRAVQVVGRGESWVPNKMLGSIMDRILN